MKHADQFKPKYTMKRWEEMVQIRKLDEDWHLRLHAKDVTRRSKNKIQVLGHFHDTTSHVAKDMVCTRCGAMPPEAIQMVLNLQKLKGKV